MPRRALRLACLLPVLLAVCPALAQGTPRSVAECERLKNDLAYNQCLAMFGPAAKNVASGDGVVASAPAPVISPAATAAMAAAGVPMTQEPEIEEPQPRGRRGRHARRGRQSMSFAVNTGADDATLHRRRYRRRH